MALKELRESNNWLRLLVKAGKIPPDRLSGRKQEAPFCTNRRPGKQVCATAKRLREKN
jgi:hypothetical protein